MMCIAIKTETNDRCGSVADYPLILSNGDKIPLCWQHAQMIKSGWYIAFGDSSVSPNVSLKLVRTGCYGK